MVDWWEALAIEKQIFYGIGIISLVVICLQLALSLLGIGGDALDAAGIDLDAAGGDFAADASGHSTGLGLFSINTITAFFLGFGWGGAILLNQGLGLPLAVLLATGIGGILMAGMYGVMLGMLRLQSDGTRKYDSAVGATASVYSTIPGGGRSSGQIEVMIGGRLTTATARHAGERDLLPGEQVRVSAREGATSFSVEPLSTTQQTDAGPSSAGDPS